MGASERLSQRSRSHSAEPLGWDTSPRFLAPNASSPPATPPSNTGKGQGSKQQSETQYGVSALEIVFSILNLIDELHLSH